VRARLNVLSEIPERWEHAVRRWRELNRNGKVRIEDEDVPDANEEYLFYQTLVGIWPPAGRTIGVATWWSGRRPTCARRRARRRSTRAGSAPTRPTSAASRTSWAAALDPGGRFLESFTDFLAPILRPGLLNSVSQTLLKIASPGVPDFYQGTELFEFVLVDPDNRGAVDFARRRALLRELAARTEAGEAARLADELLANVQADALKMFVTRQALRFRGERRALFDGGDYVPLQAAGRRQREVVAFARHDRGPGRRGGRRPFLHASAGAPDGGGRLGRLGPHGPAGRRLPRRPDTRELHAQRSGGGFELPLAEVFAHLPVALLERLA
jgi:(1->4)-alpha-D-glucan 1-alpha-D-glucosylmutase